MAERTWDTWAEEVNHELERHRRGFKEIERVIKEDTQVFEKLMTAIENILTRIEKLEAQALKYQGVYDETRSYPAGSLTTLGGSAWIAVADCGVGERPGKAATWKLAIKAGEAAKGVTLK
jgi:hypothetical protein